MTLNFNSYKPVHFNYDMKILNLLFFLGVFFMKTIIKGSRNIITTHKGYTKTLSGVGYNHCCLHF